MRERIRFINVKLHKNHNDSVKICNTSCIQCPSASSAIICSSIAACKIKQKHKLTESRTDYMKEIYKKANKYYVFFGVMQPTKQNKKY